MPCGISWRDGSADRTMVSVCVMPEVQPAAAG